MSDLDQFVALLDKCGASYDIRNSDFYFKDTAKLVEVHPGYGCHFEAEFDADGNVISMGQWDEM